MSDIQARLEQLLLKDDSAPEAQATPVERLAALLPRLGRDPVALGSCLSLLGDGLSGALLYLTHPGHVLSRLEHALEGLSSEQRFRLVEATLALRPLREEDVVRYLNLSLDALGLRAGHADQAREAWSVEQRIVVYRWSERLRSLTALQTAELSALLEARGIRGKGATPWQVFQGWFAFRASVMVTPRQSPTVRRIVVEEMQREDWLDMPWLLGTPKGTFTMEEVEEDSSPKNMADGERIRELLSWQRLPWSDFFVQAFGWLPRQTAESAREEAAKKGITLLEPASRDQRPPVAEPHQLGRDARRLQTETLRALTQIPEGALPGDLTLVFHRDADTEHGALELSVASSFRKDGQKTLVRLELGDAAEIIQVIQRHAAELDPTRLPELLARLYPHCSSIMVITPHGATFPISPEQVAAWDPAVNPQRSESRREVTEGPSSEILGSWRGTLSQMLYEDVQPFSVTLEAHDRGLRGVATTASGEQFRVNGDLVRGRLSLRQDVSLGQAFTIDCAWDREANKLEGQWRNGAMGGTLALELEAPSQERPSGAALLNEVIGAWAGRIALDLEAIRFPGERETLRALFDDELFVDEYVKAATNRALRTEAMQLESMLGRGVTELSAAMIPTVFRARDAAMAAIGFSGSPRLWVHNDASLNAFVSVDDAEITIHFTSGILEVFDEAELRAVIGHELGHVVFGSHELALRIQQTQLSGAARMRYFTLRRYQELSADRVALIACGDPRTALRAQTMLRTGIKKRELFGGPEALIEAARGEIEVLQRRADRQGALESHPYGSLRAVALDLFAQSERFTKDHTKEAQIREELGMLGRLLEAPAVHEEVSGPPNAVPRFKALASLQLIEMDNAITAKEVSTMMKLDGLAEELHEALGWSHERRHVELLALSRHVKRALSVPEREQMLMELLRVVRADNVVQYAETNALGELSWLLEVDTLSFRKTLEDLYKSAS